MKVAGFSTKEICQDLVAAATFIKLIKQTLIIQSTWPRKDL